MPGERARTEDWDSGRPLRRHSQHGPEAPQGPLLGPLARKALERGLLFFGNRICPFAHRSWWTALEKGLPLEYFHVDFTLGPKGKPSWYVELVNPKATIPVLYDKGGAFPAEKGVFAVDVPTEHIDEAYADREPHLFAGLADGERANIRSFIGEVDRCRLVPNCYAVLGNQDQAKDASLSLQLWASVRHIDALLAASGPGPFLLGDRLSAADIAIVPFLDRFEATLPHWRGTTLLPADGAPCVQRLLDACRRRAAFHATSQTPDFYVDAYEIYAGKRGRSFAQPMAGSSAL